MPTLPAWELFAMRNILTAVALTASATVASAAAGSPAVGIDLWKGARVGMSVDQVYALFDSAQPETGQSLANGAVEALSLQATIAGQPADALFFFRDKALDAVLIEQRNVRRDQRPHNLAEARELVSFATLRYGAPGRCADWRQVAALSCTWRVGGLSVGVSYLDFGGGSPRLSIIYRASP
jgi:hypothetical protein